MEKHKIVLVGGARPNFVKIAPIYHQLTLRKEFLTVLVHTGQHTHREMSALFFEEFRLPIPDYQLIVNGNTITELTAQILIQFEKVLQAEQPDMVVVSGDVTSSLACALAATQCRIPVAHVEAGLRSGDRTMPEEINRLLIDQLATLLFVSEPAGVTNLQNENISREKILLVGNVMIDTLIHYVKPRPRIQGFAYVVVTMHRPSNVDQPEAICRLVELVERIASFVHVVFPVHPRTLMRLKEFQLYVRLRQLPNIDLISPQGYAEFISLLQNASAVITDSGGIQEETTFLQVPCLTFRTTTERPITTEVGTNCLIADLSLEALEQKLLEILNGNAKASSIPDLWDGQSSSRIVEAISHYLTKQV